MGPPTTRARAKATNSGVVATQQQITLIKDEGTPGAAEVVRPEPLLAITGPLTSVLSDVEDSAAVLGRDARHLRDATVEAVAGVWQDSHDTAAQLAQTITENNASLLSGLNASFGAVDAHIRALPAVTSLVPEGLASKITPFTGSGDGVQFSIWVRRLQDLMRTLPGEISSERKANFLIAHLDGIAREKVEELSDDDRTSYESLVAHLRNCFEGPHQRHLARQALAACRQERLESSAVFANRLMNLVRAATAGQDLAAQKERALEEFTARLRPDVRYFVKLDNPVTFEQAVNKAQAVEHLLAEAAAERLINPAGSSAGISALGVPRQVRFDNPPSYNRNTPPVFRQRSGSRRGRPRRSDSGSAWQSRPMANSCFNCGGTGHFARQCPSPRSSGPKPTGRRLSSRSRFSSNESRPPARSLSPLPSPTRGDLDDARNKINALSLSLREKQEALDNSHAQVEALLKRNDELSRSVFAGASAPRPASARSLWSVNPVFLCLIMCVGLPAALAQPAWFCPSSSHDYLLRVPLDYNCSRLFPNVSSPPRNLSVSLYRPNTKRYDTPASLCKIVEQTVYFSVGFFGARYENRSETHRTVSVEHCRLMVQHNRCEHGLLTSDGSVSKTTNQLVVPWPSAPWGCCVTHSISVINCYLLSTYIHMRHGSTFPDSAVGDTRHCKYKDGTCVLSDGSVLLWTPDKEETCRFLAVSKMKGHRMGNVWLSESKELALSWDENSSALTDCGQTLIITDQGYAVALPRRMPRSSPPVGLVTSNQLAAQLLAVEDVVQGSSMALFHQALASLCDRVNMFAFSLHSALTIDPTHTVRQLLQRNDVAATYHGNGLVRVRRCMPIARSHYELQLFNATCFAKPRVAVTLPSGVALSFFLDVSTFLLSQSAEPVPCSPNMVFFIPFVNGTTRFDPVTGSRISMSADDVPVFTQASSATLRVPTPPLTIFHNLVLTNISELLSEHRLTELWEVRHYEYLLSPPGSQSQNQISRSVSSSAPALPSLWDFFSFHPFDLWVTGCCLYASFLMLKSLIRLYLKVYYPHLLQRFDWPAPPRAPGPSLSAPPLSAPSDPRVVPLPPHTLQFTKVELDAATSWPPRASVSPVVISSVDLPPSYFVAQIPIRVNTIRMLALIDTGAAITLTSCDMAPLLGTFTLQKSPIPCAIGVSGSPVKLVGYACASIQVGDYSFRHPVYFTDAPSVPHSVQAYNIILGNDLLRRLPPWSIDYANRKFVVGGAHVDIMGLTPAHEASPATDLPVRVSQTTVLEPGTETFVPCETTCILSAPLMLVAQRSALADKSLMVSPAVINSGRCRLLVSNPTDRTEVLYKDQAIAFAVRLAESDDGTFYCPHATTSETVHMDAVAVDAGPATPSQATLSFDLTQASITEAENQILRDLFSEYRDRFSLSAYDLGSYDHTEIDIKTTTDVPPMKFRPPRIPVKFQKELDDHINRLLRAICQQFPDGYRRNSGSRHYRPFALSLRVAQRRGVCDPSGSLPS